MSNLNERIDLAEKDLASLKDQLVEATKTLEAAPEEEALLVEVEELTAKVEKSSNSLNALKKAQAALAERAKPVTEAPAITKAHHMGNKERAPGDLMFKHATAKFVAHARGERNVENVVKELYADDAAVQESFAYNMKSAVNPATTGTSGWGQELVQQDTRGFLDSLKTTSVCARLASMSQSLNFGGYDSIKVPKRNPLGAALTEPAWVSEAAVIPLTQFSFGSTTINRYKLAAITTMSRELAERSTPAIEGILRSALSEAYSQVLDAAFLSNVAAVAGNRPAGILNGTAWGATATAGAAAGATAGSAVRTDLQTALAAFQTNRVGSRPVIIMNDQTRLSLSMTVSSLGDYLFRDEVGAGRLLGMEIISSANVPVGNVIIIDADSLATAFDAPMFDVSDVATVTEANANETAPTQAGTTAGDGGKVTPAITGGISVNENTTSNAAAAGFTARSLWQTYSVGLRLIAPTSWAMLRNGAVYELTSVNW